jgi:predicted component of type VI protein secretion system
MQNAKGRRQKAEGISVYTVGHRMWTLQSVEPKTFRLAFRMLPGTFKTMGRAPRADFVVDTPLVSRVHCRFTLSENDELELEDLNSTNGTLVNGEKVTKVVLRDGDIVTIGRVQFAVTSEASIAEDVERPTTLSS